MELYNNDSPAFTTWVIENDLLEEPFVVIDVGVQGLQDNGAPTSALK
jgi:hypothetical protein